MFFGTILVSAMEEIRKQEIKTSLLRKAKNINTTYKTFQFQQNPPTGIQSCIKRVSGNREPLTPHLAQIYTLFNFIKRN